ncbi:NADH-quinone oxidoreductase subunit NuoH [Salinibacillus xinjiangensis]|uniref:NADH-quinone oxidoreductase subunit H n=1 Tax=Salinibacillus xinjiangensis TaxID=1229268 RepID=A0A6G1X5H2_9BACI|nr:NADH-quinone oxidoreductase subunit NuoH [Salinibacillus xinjiangensis]MRG86187.1 NADH-quinone oxidoreductase subunit NuoH [Salinibacillus xinjiangensis]
MMELLKSPPGLSNLSTFLILTLPVLSIVLGFVTYAILAERKVLGYMQLRYGPNRTGGRFGLLQTVADVLKLLIKEDTRPKEADRPLFILAPVIAFVPSFMVLAVIPYTESVMFANIGVGLLYFIAISGLTTVGMLTAGWASNNKYALMGGMRSAAQMISYEIPLLMALVGVVLFAGSLNLVEIVEQQQYIPYILLQPIGFIIFFIAATAELNRTPFDLPEAESELIAGYHVEYSGFRFAFFMLAEYVYLFAMSALITVLYLGGWNPIIGLGFIPDLVWFGIKFSILVFVFMWVRATLPRIRPDQLMEFGWKVLLPVAMLNIFLSAILKEIFF